MSQDTSHVGKEFGNYRIADVLGKGGTSVVYRGIHRTIESEVAIKVLRASRAPGLVERFFHEALAASQIRHPGIVSVFDYGEADGDAYLVMELLQGENLGERLRRRGRLDPIEAARLMRQVCGALVAAHEADIVHRDIKPQNLFIVRDADVVGGERLRILDFGVAKLVAPASSADDGKLLLGTPLYMAPEQFRGAENTDARTDIYQVGAVLHHMLTGHPPYPDVRERMRRLAAGATDELPRLDGVPPRLAAIVLGCLQHDPAHRIPDMRVVEDALRTCLSEPTAAYDESPTIITRIPDLNRQDLQVNISRVRGMHTLTAASTASGFFKAAPIGPHGMFREGGEFFQQVRQTFEFYRKHLDDEYRQLSAQMDSAHRLWIRCVGLGFAILVAGLAAVLLGMVTQGVVTASASTVMYFIVRVFQKREDYYRDQKAVKTRYLQYGNDWLLLIQSIEAMPDGADRLEEQHRLARVLLARIEGETVGAARHAGGAADSLSPPPRKLERRSGEDRDDERERKLERRSVPTKKAPPPPP